MKNFSKRVLHLVVQGYLVKFPYDDNCFLRSFKIVIPQFEGFNSYLLHNGKLFNK